MKKYINIILSYIKKYYKVILIGLVVITLIITGLILNNNKSINSRNERIENYKNTITVYISGEIVYPGIYELNSYSNIKDLINEAKGLTPNSEVSYINLNKILEDGESIYIPKKDTLVNKTRININIASIDELTKLQGIGVEKASSIILYRTTYGPFNYIEDLLKVPGITNNILLNIKNEIKLS